MIESQLDGSATYETIEFGLGQTERPIRRLLGDSGFPRASARQILKTDRQAGKRESGKAGKALVREQLFTKGQKKVFTPSKRASKADNPATSMYLYATPVAF